MFIEIIKQLFPLNSVSTDLIINPEIEEQPQIGIYNPCFDSKDVEEREGMPKLEMSIDRILWLDFSIRYEIPKVEFVLPLLEHFKQKDKIILRKFHRKSFFGTSLFGKYEAPKEIKLPKPGKTEKFKGHYLLVFNCFMDRDFKIEEGGSICISIFGEIEAEKIVTPSSIKEAVSNFRWLLEIEEDDDPNQYAYEFSVETVTNEAMAKGIASRKVYTNMFKVVFDKNGCDVKVEYVDPRHYHLF